MSKLVRKAMEVQGAVPPPADSLFLAVNRNEFEQRLFRLADKFSVVTYRYDSSKKRRVITREEFTDFSLACITAVSLGNDAMVYAIGSKEAFGLGCMLPRAKWADYLQIWREIHNIPSAFSSSVGGRHPPNETPHMDFPDQAGARTGRWSSKKPNFKEVTVTAKSRRSGVDLRKVFGTSGERNGKNKKAASKKSPRRK